MCNAIKRMISSKRYTKEYILERIRVFYLVGDLVELEFIELKNLVETELV